MAASYLTPWGWDSTPVLLEIVNNEDKSFGGIPYVTHIKGTMGSIDGPCDLNIRGLWSQQISYLMDCSGIRLIKVTINGRTNLYVPREVRIIGGDDGETPIFEIDAVDGGGFVYGTPIPLAFPTTFKANGANMLQRLMREELGLTLTPRREFFFVISPEVDDSPPFTIGEAQSSNSIGDVIRSSLAARGYYMQIFPSFARTWRIAADINKLSTRVSHTISRGRGHIERWKFSTFGSQAMELVADVGGGTHISRQAPHKQYTSGWQYRGKVVQAKSDNVDTYFNSLQESSQLEIELSPNAPFSIGLSNGKVDVIREGQLIKVDLGYGLEQTVRVMRVEFELSPDKFTMTPILSQPDRSTRGIQNKVAQMSKEVDFIRAFGH